MEARTDSYTKCESPPSLRAFTFFLNGRADWTIVELPP